MIWHTLKRAEPATTAEFAAFHLATHLGGVGYAGIVAGVRGGGPVHGEHEAAPALEAAPVVQPPHPVGGGEAGVQGDAAQLFLEGREGGNVLQT